MIFCCIFKKRTTSIRAEAYLCRDNNETEDKATHKDNHEPPPRGFLVLLSHVNMVRVVKSALSCAAVRLFDVSAPEQETVGDEGADLESHRENSRSAFTGRTLRMGTCGFVCFFERTKTKQNVRQRWP